MSSHGLSQPIGLGTSVSNGMSHWKNPMAVPGHSGTGQDIFLSRCPFVLGQGQKQKSRDKPLWPETSWDKINTWLAKKVKNCQKISNFLIFSKQDWKGNQNPFPARPMSKSHPSLCKILSFSCCPFVLGHERTSVPLSRGQENPVPLETLLGTTTTLLKLNSRIKVFISIWLNCNLV